MKDWLTIGEFSKRTALSQKTLRLYEKAGLLRAHSRGDNRYRYYRPEQVAVAERIKQFKSFGFTLREIGVLLSYDASLDAPALGALLERRLSALGSAERGARVAQAKIREILSSLKGKPTGLNPEKRRFIMKQIENISVVVAGSRDLGATAAFIRRHIEASGRKVPVVFWSGTVPARKPYILVVSEEQLRGDGARGAGTRANGGSRSSLSTLGDLNPDIVVIQEVSSASADVKSAYLQLFRNAGPHLTTILNGDDRALVALAASEEIRKGRMYYFSKNEGLEDQIEKIGGVVSDGDKVKVYGRNPSEIEIGAHLGHSDEIAYMASIAAVMDFGIQPSSLP